MCKAINAMQQPAQNEANNITANYQTAPAPILRLGGTIGGRWVALGLSQTHAWALLRAFTALLLAGLAAVADASCVLEQNEGFAVRCTVPATGVWSAVVSVEWTEVTTFP